MQIFSANPTISLASKCEHNFHIRVLEIELPNRHNSENRKFPTNKGSGFSAERENDVENVISKKKHIQTEFFKKLRLKLVSCENSFTQLSSES